MMKWFWRVNYFLTVYLIMILFFDLIYFFKGGTEFYANSNGFKIFEKIATCNGVLQMISMIVEWIQVPVGIIILVFLKTERTKLHLFYIMALVFLNFLKWFFWLFTVAGVSTH